MATEEYIWMHPPRCLDPEQVPATEALLRQKIGWLHADAPAVADQVQPESQPGPVLAADEEGGEVSCVKSACDNAAGSVPPAAVPDGRQGRPRRGREA